MPALALFEILEGIISSVPQAIELYNKLVPLIAPKADIHPDAIAEVNALVPKAHAAVETAHTALETLISAHTSNATPPAPPAAS